MTDFIRIEHLQKKFGDIHAVNDLSFRVGEGELFAFLGVNGAGKSTTINILCGQLSKDGGTVKICGIDPEDAIAGTCEKFIRRFRVMEQEAVRQGRALHDMTLEEMTALWNGAKERS